MLTKSLHTITAATNVARFILETRRFGDAAALAGRALEILGYPTNALSDPTVARIVKNCEALIVAAERAA